MEGRGINYRGNVEESDNLEENGVNEDNIGMYPKEARFNGVD
jgi:hypothetical protein